MNPQTLNGERDISAHIGALELGAIKAVDDGELEATVHAGPSTHLRRSTVCLNIDDGAFEATIHAGPNAQVTLLRNSRRGCEFVEVKDDVLEATVQAGPQRPTAIRLPGGGCLPGVDDGTLEGTFQTGPSTMRPACPFIDDGMLEAVAPVLAGPTGMTCPPPQTMRPICRYIDDAALETAAAHADVGPPPTSIRFPDGGCNGR